MSPVRKAHVAGLLATCVLAPAAAATADDTADRGGSDRPTPVEANGVYTSWFYRGTAHYDRTPRPRFTLGTNATGTAVRISPGYFQKARRCGLAKGAIYSTGVPGKAVLPLREDGTFSGSGRGRQTVGGHQVLSVTWRVSGMFSSPTQAHGILTISAKDTLRGKPFLSCDAQRVSWQVTALDDPRTGRF